VVWIEGQSVESQQSRLLTVPLYESSPHRLPRPGLETQKVDLGEVQTCHCLSSCPCSYANARVGLEPFLLAMVFVYSAGYHH